MRAEIRNFRGIGHADLTIAPIALVAGRNGAGKSSILQAVAAAVADQPIPYIRPGSSPGQYAPVILKKSAGVLVRDGQTEGVVALSGPSGKVSVSWPGLKVRREEYQKGAMGGSPRASVIAAGMVDLMAMDDATRSTLLIGLLGADPDADDLMAALKEYGIGGSTATRTVNAVQASGWGHAEGKIRESATQFKGQWRGITGEAYGPRKAESWRPAGWTDDLDKADPAQLQAEETQARKALEASIGKQAVGTDELRRLEEQSQVAVDLAPLEAAVEAAEAAYREAGKARNALPTCHGVGGMNGARCPHCQGGVVVESSALSGGFVLNKAEPLDKGEVGRRLDAIARADGTLSRRQGEMWSAQRKLTDGRNQARQAEDARKRLEGAKSRTVPVAQVEQARERLQVAQDRLQAVDSRGKADGIHGSIARLMTIAGILSPDGLRRDKLIRSLEPFNGDLDRLCRAAGWSVVHLHEDLTPWYDGRPWVLLSESERYRVRATLQLAIASRDGSALVILDGADILDQPGRNGLFKALRSAKLPALVAMTANNPGKVPDLAAAGLGHSYWIEDGTTTAVSQSPARAA